MPKLTILVSGFARSGKNHTSDLLTTELASLGYSVTQEAFATPMKRIIATTLGITTDELENLKDEPNLYNFGFATPTRVIRTDFRQILQKFGSEAMKPIFGTNVWGELMLTKLHNSQSDIVIITDYRFDTEYNYITTHLPTLHIHISSATISNHSTHASEQLPTHKPNFTIDNTTKSDLSPQITDLATKIKELL